MARVDKLRNLLSCLLANKEICCKRSTIGIRNVDIYHNLQLFTVLAGMNKYRIHLTGAATLDKIWIWLNIDPEFAVFIVLDVH